MKRLISLLSILCIALAVSAGTTKVIKRGAAVPADAKAVAITDVLAKPADYTKTPVVVEGLVMKACTTKGCWMELVPSEGKPGVRMTFKDYGFFVPLNAKGMKARAEGVASIKTLSKSDADHLEGEGAKFVRNADGTVDEVSFVASGVELRRE